ncbi:LOW QUALITY PROTEIN: lysophospholipase D GDPD3 [Ctenodactylus gundi]
MSPLLFYALPALGSYIMLSIFLLRRPHLLHTTRAPAFLPRLGAHRGGSGERLENTMEAMENSMAQRADLLELDCHLTQDGVVVVSHDKNLSRQSGLNRDVSSLNFEELPLYKEELEVYFSPGHFACGSDRHMVRLEDLFQRFPQVPMSVEIKEDNQELIHKVAGLVRRFDRSEITIWASGKSSVMKKCKAANPQMPLSFSWNRALWMLLLYYLGLLPFVPIPEKFFLCFLPTIINRTYFPFSRSGLNQLAAVVSKWVIMRKSLIRHLEERGVQVVFWCLNEESDFEVAFSLGATGVITDYPTALRQYLDTGPAPPAFQDAPPYLHAACLLATAAAGTGDRPPPPPAAAAAAAGLGVNKSRRLRTRAGGDGAHQERPPLPGQAPRGPGPAPRRGEARAVKAVRRPAPPPRQRGLPPSPAPAP